MRRTRIADIAIIHFKTSFVGYRGRGMPRPYKALPPQGYRHDFATLTGRSWSVLGRDELREAVIAMSGKGGKKTAKLLYWGRREGEEAFAVVFVLFVS